MASVSLHTSLMVASPPMASPSGNLLRMYSSDGRHVSATGAKALAADAKDLGARVSAFLRGRHPTKTADHAAAETGLGRSRIAKWLEGASKPDGIAILSLLDTYGPDFVAAIWPKPFGFLSTAARTAKAAELDAAMVELQRQRAEL